MLPVFVLNKTHTPMPLLRLDAKTGSTTTATEATSSSTPRSVRATWSKANFSMRAVGKIRSSWSARREEMPKISRP